MTPEPETTVDAEQQKAAAVPAPADKPQPVTEPAAEPAETKPGDAPEAGEEAATGEKKAEPAPAKRTIRWGSLCLDTFLVLLLIAVLAAAGYYFRITADRYHVPTPMELLLSESEQLDRSYNELLPLANHADAQLHMRARLAQLEGQLSRFSAQIAEKKASIDDQHGQVLAMQYSIRQADETNRGIARSLLPGMPVGTITTTKGEAYRNAILHRLSKRYVDIRYPEGQVRVPLRELVKDNLPDLARYAFGEIDLVDMSDFEQTSLPKAEAPAKPAPAKRPAPRPAQAANANYDPAPGVPVLDTNANDTTTSRVPEEGQREVETWDAPSGDLPM